MTVVDLITYGDFTDRMGPVVSATLDTEQVEAYIHDVSELVRDAAAGELDLVDKSTPAPGVIVVVVVSAVRRCLVNPDGDASEMLDGHRVDGRHQDGVFLTRREEEVVKRWAGVSLSAKSLTLDADMPIPRTESVPLEEIGWVRL